MQQLTGMHTLLVCAKFVGRSQNLNTETALDVGKELGPEANKDKQRVCPCLVRTTQDEEII